MCNLNDVPEIIIDDFKTLFDVFYENIYIPERDKEHNQIDYNPIKKYHNSIIFRGHKEETYKLESTLERHIREIFPSVDKENFEKISKEYLEYCRQELKGKIQDQYILNNDDSVWALGQHYGLKTPLLDWTRSFLFALFFAFEERISKTEYRVVYALNCFWAMNNVDIVEPEFPIGSRITAQQGLFTKMFSSELEAVNMNFSNIGGIEEIRTIKPLIKYKIKSSLREDIMNFLSSLNVDSYTIYPDLQGAIKNCHIQLEDILKLGEKIGFSE